MSFSLVPQRQLWRHISRSSSRRLAAIPTAPTTIARRAYSSGSQEEPKDSGSKGAGSDAGNKNTIKFWPFFLIIGAGSLAYVQLARRRADPSPPDAPKQLAAPSKPTPTFSSTDVTVVFVLGGPGAGKGTQCANLVRDYGFVHLSAGDLLRAEQDRPGSQFGDLIRDYIKNGQIVPMEVTVQLLENAMTEAISAPSAGNQKAKFLIDGFPRKMDQAHAFEDRVCKAGLVLFFDCPEKELERRLLERGKSSGRADDNMESIRKRFRTFIETSMPVVQYYEGLGRVVKVDSTPAPEAVYEQTWKELEGRLEVGK